MTKAAPAAGAKGGKAPNASRVRVPDFLLLRQPELHRLLNVLVDMRALHLYLVLLAASDFKTGEVITSYADLMAVCTPPRPERGQPRPGPTYKQLRGSIDQLEEQGLVRRGDKNAAQGTLQLFVKKRKTTAAISHV